MFQSTSLRIFGIDFQLKVIYILIVLVLAGAFIRFFKLTYSSLWLDEIFSMLGSDPSGKLIDVYNYSRNDQPPVFFFLLYGWLKLFGYTDVAGRALTCMIGLAGIINMFYLGKELRDEKLGLITAFITTINFFHIDLSKEIRFYSLVFLLSSLSYLFFMRSLKDRKIGNLVLYMLFTALLLNTHYYGMVVFVSQFLIFIFVLICFIRSYTFLFQGFFFGALAALSLWHYLPIIFGDLEIESFHIGPLKSTFIFDLAWSYFRDPVAFAIYILCGLLVAVKMYDKIKVQAVKIEHVVVFGWIFLGLSIPIIYSLAKFPLINFRYTTIVVPGVLVAIASGFGYIKSRDWRSYALTAIALSGIIVLFFARPPYKHRRAEDWRDVGLYFKTHPHQGVKFSQLAWFHQYYFRKNGLPAPIDQNVADFNSAIKNEDSVWLFNNSRYTGGWPVNGFLPAQQDSISRNFEAVDTVGFRQTQAILFIRK